MKPIKKVNIFIFRFCLLLTSSQGQQNLNEDKGLAPPAKDDDPEGTKLLSSSDGLETAAKLLRPLTNLLASSNINVREKVEGMVKDNERIEIWLTSYDVAIRRRTFSLPPSLSVDYRSHISTQENYYKL